jgi:serine protease Do
MPPRWLDAPPGATLKPDAHRDANRTGAVRCPPLRHAVSRRLLVAALALALAGTAAARDALPTFAPLLRRAGPSVVTIVPAPGPGEAEAEPETLLDVFRRLLAEPADGQAVGSGFVVSAEGDIVTSTQALPGVDAVRVRLASGEELDARLVGSDDKSGIALLRVEAGHPLTALPLAADDDVPAAGDWLVALGNPTGQALTASATVLAARGRLIGAGPGPDFLQTDAPVAAGAGGGPLLDQQGRVVGMSVALPGSPGAPGFAVPVELVRWVVDQIRRHGRVLRGWIGVSVQPVTPTLAHSFGLPATEGALVADVAPDSPGAAAGIERGDVILRFGDTLIASSKALPAIVHDTLPGMRVPVTLVREGREMTVELLVGELPPPPQPPPASPPVAEEWGLLVEPLTATEAKRRGLEPGTGVLVVDVAAGGAADDTGLEPGDAIVEIDRKKVASVDEFWAALAERDHALVLVRRGRTYLYLDLRR